MDNFRFAILIASALTSTHVVAWGAQGHQLIAALAESQLTQAASAEVHRLLAQEPGATMVSVSTWADEQRKGTTAALHYVNLPGGDCTYHRPRDCADGRCVVEAINANAAVLMSEAPDPQRLVALKWLIHLVGDIHQPLHVGLASDKGGNLFQLRSFSRGSNLHAFWDSDFIRHRAGGLSRLMGDAKAAIHSEDPSTAPAKWANASCVIRSSGGFYPAERMIDAAYVARWDRVLVEQLALAGHRLANVLNASARTRD